MESGVSCTAIFWATVCNFNQSSYLWPRPGSDMCDWDFYTPDSARMVFIPFDIGSIPSTPDPCWKDGNPIQRFFGMSRACCDQINCIESFLSTRLVTLRRCHLIVVHFPSDDSTILRPDRAPFDAHLSPFLPL